MKQPPLFLMLLLATALSAPAAAASPKAAGESGDKRKTAPLDAASTASPTPGVRSHV